MATSIFFLNTEGKSLRPLAQRTMEDLGLTETRDLETWLASCDESAQLFRRKILWLARQDRVSDDQRTDLVGVADNGDLIIAELKRGTLNEDAVTQALGYAGEYATKTLDELLDLFVKHSSSKPPQEGLVMAVTSIEDVQNRLEKHAGSDTEINENQVILLVGEGFSPKALTICDYLNSSSGEASFLLECWQYMIVEDEDSRRYFVLEQIIPPPSMRDVIEEKREAAKHKKRLRDPVRMAFMYAQRDRI